MSEKFSTDIETIEDHIMGNAIPLISIVNKKFVLNKEAIEALSDDKNKAIGIISLVGKYRTGKSFLLNRVLLNNKLTSNSFGFSVGPTVKPCTKGIWMWSKPMKVTNNHFGEEFNVYFIDTEGLGAYDEEINHDSKIFLIAMLISSLFLLNSFSSIDENAINNLSLILNLTQTIKLNKEDEKTNPEDLSRFFPSLLWLLRDFSLKLEDTEGNTITAKQYLENALALVKGQSSIVEEKNRVRQMIKLYFQERDCFTMIRPVESEEHLQNLNSLPDNYFRMEFLNQCDTLRNKIFKKVKPKIFNGKIMSGKMTINLLSSIIEALNQGTIPIIESTWNYVVAAEGTKHFECLIKEYNDSLSEFFNKMKNMNSNDLLSFDFNNELSSYNKNIQNQLTERFEKIVRSIDETNSLSLVEKFKQKLLTNFKDVSEAHQKLFKEKFSEILNSQFAVIEKKINEKVYFYNDNIAKIPDIVSSSKNINPNNTNNISNISSIYNQYSSILSQNVNYHLFFQDIDNIKELLYTSTPNFSNKNEEIHQKQISTIKYFIEENFIKEKNYKDLEIIRLINEKVSVERKLNNFNEEMNELKEDFKLEKEKLQSDNFDLKGELRGKIEIISNMEKERRKLIDNYEENFQKNIKDNNEDRNKQEKKLNNLENELKIRDNQILTMKFNEEKLNALNTQKTEFLEKEIESLHEKNRFYTKINEEQKYTLDTLNNNVEELKNELNTLRNNSMNNNTSNYNEEVVLKEKQMQIDSLKLQMEETKKIYEEVIQNLKISMKESNKLRDSEIESRKEENNNGAVKDQTSLFDYREIIESNKV